jgi:uroporphyrinogen III methyltransferase/synthase
VKENEHGTVYLVGAGPGDPGLITVKGRSLLERAEVVIYDYLANKKFLKLVPPEAELLYVGKRGGKCHSHTQEEINQMIIDWALSGKTVVRLKGGDPFIFGRGGEEIEELVKSGIKFEVVPGVTAASAAATYAGIPITHRKYTATVAFVTGHEDPTKKSSNIDWQKLATGVGTLVFYMGIKNLPTIMERLIRYGRDPKTPVAVIRWASTPEHHTEVGTLETMADIAQAAGIKPPAVIVVGEVVKLRDTMNWFEQRPLFGKKIMVTRTREQASELVERLEDQGADCLEFATIALEPPDSWQPLDEAVAGMAVYDWILFTSINAIKYFFGRLLELGLDARCLHGVKIAAVGSATDKELRKYGLRADLLPESEFTGQGLADELLKANEADGKKFLLPRAKKGGASLSDTLVNAGGEVDIVPIYQNIRPKGREEELRRLLAEKQVDMVTFTSSSTVKNFIFMLNATDQGELDELVGGLDIASIGPITSKAAVKNGLQINVQPDTYTIKDMVNGIVDYYKK